jgi:cell division protein FtsW (lipid II flippase)
MRFLLILASLPALAGSLLIMQYVGANRGLIVQQAMSALIACGACALSTWRRKPGPSRHWAYWISAFSLFALAIPFADLAYGPHRWIDIGAYRLYPAALVLPSMLYVLASAIRIEGANRRWPLPIAIVIAALLSAHPDASQVTAFAFAIAVSVLIAKRRPVAKLLSVGTMAACVAWAWSQPDPLEPVIYVEGVFDVARASGVAGLSGVLVSIALPPLAMAWQARATDNPALLAVAVYYVAIDFFVWLQLTPMPLLGFGLSPLLGYFLFACLAAKQPTE